MLQITGPARIIEGPFFTNVDGKGERAEMVVEFSKGSTLQLICPTYSTTQTAYQLEKGHTVHFTGYLSSYDPGVYFVKITEIHREKRSNR